MLRKEVGENPAVLVPFLNALQLCTDVDQSQQNIGVVGIYQSFFQVFQGRFVFAPDAVNPADVGIGIRKEFVLIDCFFE